MPDSTVPANVRALASQMAEPKPMRRGSVSERYVKCNKTGCLCADQSTARHGPYFSVSRVIKGRTKSRWLDGEQAKRVRQQVEAGQQFRRRVNAYWEACEKWADAQLEAPQAVSETEAAKKGGSKKSSTTKSSTKSKR